MVFTPPLMSKSVRPFIHPSVTVLRAGITIDITFTSMFHSFFNSQARSRFLSFFSLSFNFILWSAGTVHNSASSLFLLLTITSRDLGDPFVSKNPRGVCSSHSPGQILGFAYSICSYSQISISCTFPSESVPHPVVFSLLLFLC